VGSHIRGESESIAAGVLMRGPVGKR